MESSGIQAILLTHMLQFSIAITLVAMIVWLTSRRWPHFTFLVCMLALAKCLVPPFITSPAGIFTRHSGLAFSPQLERLGGDEVILLKQAAQGYTEVGASSCEPVRAAWIPDATTQVMQSLNANSEPFHWSTVLLICWLAGAGIVLSRAMWQYAMLLRLLRRAKPAQEKTQVLARRVQLQLGLKRKVTVLVSSDGYGPACIGFFRPKLVLPSVLVSRWSDEMLRPVLAHEMVHARRGDIIWGYLQFAAQVVWWFHPLVWWIGRRAHLLCERCCDVEVVAATECSAAEYGESLVRVLELKGEFRAVPLAHAMSPAEVTGQRLERIMKQCGHYSKRTSRASWALAAIVAALMIPGMQWVNAQEDAPAKTEQIQYKTEVNQALEKGQWSRAIELLRPVVEQQPRNGNAVFILGYALHANGDLVEALEYHRRAAEFSQVRPTALYNWACALALQGDKDGALKQLGKSLDAGFVHGTDLMDDPDLKSLFDTPEFKNLRSRTKCELEEALTHRQFDFWIGRWRVTNSDGDRIGSSIVTSSDKGHVLTEKWTNRGGETGTSINYFHPQQNKWRQTWVDDKGGVINFEGEFEDGRMQFVGDMFDSKGQKQVSRMTFTPQENGTIEQVIEKSSDDGVSWKIDFQGTYHRKPEPSAAELTDA